MGAVLVLLSATGFGALAIFGKFAYATGVSPATLLLVRFALAALLLGTVVLLRPGLRRWPPSPGRVLAIAFGLGAIGYAAQASFFFAALQRMNASLLSLILYTYPALVTVSAALLGRERLTRGRVAALVTASGGTLLVLLGAGGFPLAGTLLGFGAAVTYTIYILVADTVVQRLPPVLLSTVVMTGAAVSLGVRSLLTGGTGLGFGVAGWFWLACIAVVSTVLAMLAFFAGLKRTGPSTAAILSTFEPVVTTALAAVSLGETLTPVQWAGGVLVLASVAILQVRPGPLAPDGVRSRRRGRASGGGTAWSAVGWRRGSARPGRG